MNLSTHCNYADYIEGREFSRRLCTKEANYLQTEIPYRCWFVLLNSSEYKIS
jgi:hypothetical protein